MLKKRLIFSLLLDGGVFQLSRNFRLQAVGDLKWLRAHYDFDAIAHSVDELVVLNVERTVRPLQDFARHLASLADQCFVPMAAGGGIRSLDDGRLLLRSGADRLIVNTPLVRDPELVRALVTEFGAQSVTASIDYKCVAGRREVFIENGAVSSGMSVEEAVLLAQELGVGELYLTSIDKDGTGTGLDLATASEIAPLVRVPLIASGGVGRFDHFWQALELTAIDAVSTANLFHFMADGLTEARVQIRERGVPLAAWDTGWKTGRAALVVTARSRSSRLPKKMFLDVEGRPALWYPLDRMKAAKLPDSWLVCTSDAPDDDRIAALGRENGYLAFQGDEEDVLQRYLQAAMAHRLEFIVNIDGDDLFCSVQHVDRIIERYRATGADFISCSGLPFGGAPIGVKVEALRKVCAQKMEVCTQGWGKYFTESGRFRTEVIEAEPELHRPALRLTLDYPEDLELFRATVRGLGAGHLSIREVVAWLDEHPEVAAVSERVTKKYWERFQREHGAFELRDRSG